MSHNRMMTVYTDHQHAHAHTRTHAHVPGSGVLLLWPDGTHLQRSLDYPFAVAVRSCMCVRMRVCVFVCVSAYQLVAV